MNKREFMQYLEKRLSVLNKKEREDIFREYSQHIDMKVQSGLTEYEAIKDFGDVKEFVDEILEAYNIDPDFEEEISHTNPNVIDKTKSGIKAAADFIFSQSPAAVLKMLAKTLIVAIVLILLVLTGYLVLYNILDRMVNSFLPQILGVAVIVAYLMLSVAVSAYILFIYVKKLAISNTQGKSVFTSIKAGVNNLTDFILTQKPSALIAMAFKIFVMAAVLFGVGLVGMLLPALVSTVLEMFVGNISEVIFFIYLIIAVPVCVYILYNYIIRLAVEMSGNKVNVSDTVESETMDFNKNDNIVESELSITCKNESGNKAVRVSGAADPFTGFLKAICRFLKKAVCLAFKLCVLMGLGAMLCVFLPAVAFTGFALVFMLMGYPVIGIFIAGLGFSLSCLAFILIIWKAVFKRRRESI